MCYAQYKDGGRSENGKGGSSLGPDFISSLALPPGHLLLSNDDVPHFLLVTELGRFGLRSAEET